MNAVVERLVRAYREQLACYDEVLDLSRRGKDLARARRPLEELNALAIEKKERLSRVERIESEIAEDKRWWREVGRDELGSPALDSLLRELTSRIEAILHTEREIEALILDASGLDEAAPTAAVWEA